MSDLFNLFESLNSNQEIISGSRDKDILRAPFGYPGGKDKSVKQILDVLPVRDVFVDHCGGSGIITLNRKQSKVLDVYNDRWSGVFCFWQCIKDKDKYLELMDYINMSMHTREQFVYAKENWEEPKLGDVERAGLWFLMLNQSFGKLGRNWARALNSKVSFKRTFDIPYFTQLHQVFGRTQIENADLMNMLGDYNKPGMVHYIDPPYPFTDTGIYKHKFPNERHNQFLDYIFNNGQGYYAVSSYKNTIYDKYPWDNIIEWPVTITIDSKSSSEGGHRQYTGEKLNVAYEQLYIKEES